MMGEGSYDFLRRKADSAEFLTKDRERELLRRWLEQADHAARNEIVTAHLRLCLMLASKFANYGLPRKDLVQEANLGLLIAVNKFRLEYDNRLSTYAVWWIKAAIHEFILRNWSIVRIPSSEKHRELFYGLRKIREKIEKEMGADANSVEVTLAVAREFEVGVRDVEGMQQRLMHDSSLNAPVDGGENSMQRLDLLVDSNASAPEDKIDVLRVRGMIEAAMESLTPRQRIVVRARKFCHPDEVETLSEIGAKMGVTSQRVKQIEDRALEIMREALAGKGGLADFLEH